MNESGDEYVNDAIDDAIKATCGFPTWRPIATAPRDGSVVLLWAPAWRAASTGWTYANDFWQDCPKYNGSDPTRIPTHWMPAPTPPLQTRTDR